MTVRCNPGRSSSEVVEVAVGEVVSQPARDVAAVAERAAQHPPPAIEPVAPDARRKQRIARAVRLVGNHQPHRGRGPDRHRDPVPAHAAGADIGGRAIADGGIPRHGSKGWPPRGVAFHQAHVRLGAVDDSRQAAIVQAKRRKQPCVPIEGRGVEQAGPRGHRDGRLEASEERLVDKVSD